ncbi:MAG: hypothetical protein K0R18_99 [Bacillales bacterium]|jgi:hypothetical protein|nr:hypothetical protein [Bacillales bacterium]
MEFKEKVQEVKDIMEEFYILLSLSLGTELKLGVQENIGIKNQEDRVFVTIYNPRHPYIMRVGVYKNEIVVVLDKSRYNSGIIFHYKLRNYKKDAPPCNEIGKNIVGCWYVVSNEPEMLRDVISVINKRVKVYNT